MTEPETATSHVTAADRFHETLRDFRKTKLLLQQLRTGLFPQGSVVRIGDVQFCQLAIVFYDEDCPPDQLPLLMESGNVWWYPIEQCNRIREPRLWPRWIRQRKLPRALITGKQQYR